jgi:hypothetical protein
MTIVIYEMYANFCLCKCVLCIAICVAPLSLFFKYSMCFVLTCAFLSQDKIALV